MNTLNTSHTGRWKVNISNIPSLSKVSEIGLYEKFCKSVSIPDQSVDIDFFTDHNLKRFSINAKPNSDLTDIQITFKVSEDMLNYYNLLDYMLQLKTGEVDTDTIRENVTKVISIISLDNSKRERGLLNFHNCFLHSISSIALEMGSAEENVFTTNWKPEYVTYSTSTI